MITIELPEQIEKAFTAIAQRAGKTPEDCAREALLKFYEDLEDLMDAEEAMKNHRPEEAISLEDVIKKYGLEN
jgi:predicted DNA-binding protein